MIKSVLNLHKKLYETPLETIQRFKTDNPEYKEMPMTYAGRLDPMAEGVLIVLVGEECKNKEKYLGFDKEYEFEVLFGIETDSLDLLGLITNINSDVELDETKLKEVVKNLIGEREQEYPLFSSKTINGKQLFQIFKDGDEIEEMPKRRINIYDLEILKIRTISVSRLQNKISEMLKNIKGDFRQDKIGKSWQEFFAQNKLENFQIAKLKVKCSSGTYVRKICEEIGKKISVPAIAISIVRIKVGDWI